MNGVIGITIRLMMAKAVLKKPATIGEKKYPTHNTSLSRATILMVLLKLVLIPKRTKFLRKGLMEKGDLYQPGYKYLGSQYSATKIGAKPRITFPIR